MSQLARLNKTLTDTSGNALSGATFTVYREGATVAVGGGATGATPLTITVVDAGKIVAGDAAFVNTTTTTLYTVVSVTGRTSIVVSWTGGGTRTIADGDRIVPSTSQPTLYADDYGTATKSNPLTSSATGLVQCWLEFGTYDGVAISGTTKVLDTGFTTSTENPGQIRYADDYAVGSSTGGIQEAIDDLPSTGGIVHCSAKTYSTTKTVWLHNGCHLHGSGIGNTIIKRSTGSIVDGDGNNTGMVINCGPRGSNGTQFSTGTHGSDISISDLTLDGNQSNFTSLTNANLSPQGLRSIYVDGLYINNVKAQNTLGTGFYLSQITRPLFKSFYCDTVGQWSVTSDRNALSIYQTTDGSFSNFSFVTIGDEGITLGEGCSNLSISNGSVNVCDFGIEFTGSSNNSNSNIVFSNIDFTGLLSTCITFNSSGTITNSGIKFCNLNFSCDASNHNAGVVAMGGAASTFSDITFCDITATNINSKDTTTNHWIDVQGISRSRLRFSNMILYGKSGSTRTADVALNINPSTGVSAQDIFFENIFIKDVAGFGASCNSATTGTISNIHFNNVCVDGANAWGFFVRNYTTASTVKEIYFNNCIAKDCVKQTGTAGWYTTCTIGSGSVNNIYLRGCRSYKTAGATHQYGLFMEQSAGTLGPIEIVDCDFSGTQTGWFNSSGTVTDTHFKPQTRRGTDITSGTTVTIPPDGTLFHVTGTAAITTVNVNPWDNGRTAVLMMESTAQVADGANQKLSAAGPNSADDTLTLTCDGTSWFEIGRSVN